MESLNQVIKGMREEEKMLDAIILMKEEQLADCKKKKKRRMDENGLYLGGGRVKRIRLSQQIKHTEEEVIDLANRIEEVEGGLSSLDDTFDFLRGDLEAIQGQVDELQQD